MGNPLFMHASEPVCKDCKGIIDDPRLDDFEMCSSCLASDTSYQEQNSTK